MLDLTGNEICGVRSSGTEPFNAYVVRMVCRLTFYPNLTLNLT